MTTTRDAAAIFTPRGITKGLATFEAGKVRPTNQPNVFLVPGSEPGVVYRCQIDYDGPRAVWVTCTCPHGQHRRSVRDTVCYHATAALWAVLRRDGGGMNELLAVEEA